MLSKGGFIFSQSSEHVLILIRDSDSLSFSAVTLLFGHLTHKIVPEVTYNVLSGIMH